MNAKTREVTFTNIKIVSKTGLLILINKILLAWHGYRLFYHPQTLTVTFSEYPYLNRCTIFFFSSTNLNIWEISLKQNTSFDRIWTFIPLCRRNSFDLMCFWPLSYKELHNQARFYLHLKHTLIIQIPSKVITAQFHI